MQVVAAVVGSPFVADQRGKPPRLVIALGGAGVVLPDRARELLAQHRFWHRAGADRADDLDRRLARAVATGCHQVVPAPQRRVRHQVRVALLDLLGGAQPLGMIGDHQEIERAAQPDRLAGGGNHLLAASEAVGRLRAERVAEGGGIQRIGGMQMGVTPENARRIISAGIRRIARRLIERRGLVPVQCADVGADFRGRVLGICHGQPEQEHREGEGGRLDTHIVLTRCSFGLIWAV